MSRLVAAACIATLGFLPSTSAHAATTGNRVTATTRSIDSTAQRWFAMQAEAARLDASIADVQHRIDATQATIARLRKIATARAVVLYKNADLGVMTIFGESALDSARRAHLVNDANAGGDAAISELAASVDDLEALRHNLEQQRTRQQQVFAAVARERHTLDAELETVRAQARREAAAALAAARGHAARLRAGARLRSLTASHSSDAFAAPTGAPLPAAPPTTLASPPPLPSAPVDTGRVSPHHNDPFLVCTRARESAGQYDAVSPSGYYGAYQFLPSTWDSTALHASRRDLVGVLPSRASAYDQDELAWALYQWQGNAPWGGRC